MFNCCIHSTMGYVNAAFKHCFFYGKYNTNFLCHMLLKTDSCADSPMPIFQYQKRFWILRVD